MNEYIEVLNTYLAKNPLQFGCCNMESLLGMLYCCYYQCCGGDSQEIGGYFARLEYVLCKLSRKENDRVIDLATGLCETYQKEALKNGILIGFRLFRELTENKEPLG